ncbi:hypothetical protein [Mammaliicoccus lentus]|uniref:hypothetical protein n=1 Tax=Mammaliicoccus lentus TaxID=42858 RepID=UPI001B31FB58|nr:hypothetical protein [Mammaliicoccus lentus]
MYNCYIYKQKEVRGTSKKKIVRFNFLRSIIEEYDRDDIEFNLGELFRNIEKQYHDFNLKVEKAKKEKISKEHINKISNYFYTDEHLVIENLITIF